ncbi:MAG TPA: ATP-binding protein [Candidatus Limnocylindrales bacterium]|nr:ATP-binding protein [Candidatus Limnocylindrales bacterium]
MTTVAASTRRDPVARPRRVGSLRWRLGVAFALVLAIMLGLVLAVAGAIVERALIQSTADRLEIEAGFIASESGGRRGVTATDLAAGDLAAVLGGQETAVVVLDGTGATLATQANGAHPAVVGARLDPARYASVIASGQAVEAVLPAGSDAERVLVVAVPVQVRTTGGPPEDRGRPDDKGPPPGRGLGNVKGNGGGNAGAGNETEATTAVSPNAVAQLAVSLAPVDAELTELRATLLALGIGILVAAVAIAWVVTSIGLRPLEAVATAADRVAAGDLSARAHLPDGSGEIGRLGRAFDEMVERVEASLRSQRQFAADASHELRSPLTVLGGFVDVLARGDAGRTEEGARTLAAMRREIDRLSRLASDLLLLGQLAAGGGNLEPRRLDLGELVEDIGAAVRVIADGRRVAIERDGPLPIVADRDRLTQALMNLVDNAVRHTPSDGLISLAAARDGASAVATVSNEGRPIDPRHLPHVFERFYRVSPAEGDDGRSGHAGLGLPIVRAIAEASGGSVEVASDDRVTRFAVRLPLDES